MESQRGIVCISIHAPRAGSDNRLLSVNDYAQEFQSTLPVRGATLQSPQAMRRAEISIHAPRAGSDLVAAVVPAALKAISIHAPRAGRD